MAQTGHILIVEDEALVRFDLVDFFTSEGWTVHEAVDAEEALRVLHGESRVTVVLVDVALPGSMDGLRLAHEVRRRFPPTKLYVTSGVRTLVADELPSAAVFVPKPFDNNRLLRSIVSAP